MAPRTCTSGSLLQNLQCSSFRVVITLCTRGAAAVFAKPTVPRWDFATVRRTGSRLHSVHAVGHTLCAAAPPKCFKLLSLCPSSLSFSNTLRDEKQSTGPVCAVVVTLRNAPCVRCNNIRISPAQLRAVCAASIL